MMSTPFYYFKEDVIVSDLLLARCDENTQSKGEIERYKNENIIKLKSHF